MRFSCAHCEALYNIIGFNFAIHNGDVSQERSTSIEEEEEFNEQPRQESLSKFNEELDK